MTRIPSRPAHPADRWIAAGQEPSLAEALADPIMALLFRRDRLSYPEVAADLAAAGRRLALSGHQGRVADRSLLSCCGHA